MTAVLYLRISSVRHVRQHSEPDLAKVEPIEEDFAKRMEMVQIECD